MAGGQRVFKPASRSAKKDGLFRTTRTGFALRRLRMFSPPFVCSLGFSGFASAKALEMSLAANISRAFAFEGYRGRLLFSPRQPSHPSVCTRAPALMLASTDVRGLQLEALGRVAS